MASRTVLRASSDAFSQYGKSLQVVDILRDASCKAMEREYILLEKSPGLVLSLPWK